MAAGALGSATLLRRVAAPVREGPLLGLQASRDSATCRIALRCAFMNLMHAVYVRPLLIRFCRTSHSTRMQSSP